MLKFNGKTMKKAVVAEEFAIEDEHFCISSIERSDSVLAKCGMEVWVFNEAECDSYGSREMCLCWFPKFGFATAIAFNLIDLIPTESPEEKEALDMIGVTSKQVESLAKGDVVEWDGEGLPPVGCVVLGSFHYNKDTAKEWRIDYISKEVGVYTVVESREQYTFATRDVVFHRAESQEQKSERERLEAAFEVYLAFWSASKSTIITMNMSEFKECSDLNYWLAVVDKTGYRKQ